MSSLKELLAQREELDKIIQETRKKEADAALAKVQQLIAEFEFTQENVFPKQPPRSGTTKRVTPKYRDPQTGQTWSGRGKAPKWIQGRERNEFLISTK